MTAIIEILIMLEKEAHETVKGLLNKLSRKYKLQHDVPILLPQFYKEVRH